jgi:hypothetical protein
MKKLQERLQKNEMGVSGSEDDEQQEALLKSSGLMPKSTEKEEEDKDSKVINLNHLSAGQQASWSLCRLQLQIRPCIPTLL